MRKGIKLLAALLFTVSVAGCGNEVADATIENYESAIDNHVKAGTYNFTRDERVINASTGNIDHYQVQARYTTNNDYSVKTMNYVYNYTSELANGTVTDSYGVTLTYDSETRTATQKPRGNATQTLENVDFAEAFNSDNYCNLINAKYCDRLQPLRMLPINEMRPRNVKNLSVSGKVDGAEVTFTASCPEYEYCLVGQDELRFIVNISNDKFKQITYTASTGDYESTVNYIFS